MTDETCRPSGGRHGSVARDRPGNRACVLPARARISSRWRAPQGGLEELDDEINAAGSAATLVPLDLKDFPRDRPARRRYL